MKIIVTIINCETNQSYDIQVDNKQKMQTTFRVLKENMPQIFYQIEETGTVQSFRSKRRLFLQHTYEEAHIYSGDKLLISKRGKGKKQS